MKEPHLSSKKWGFASLLHYCPIKVQDTGYFPILSNEKALPCQLQLPLPNGSGGCAILLLLKILQQ
jgi:hypothetical protein